MPTEFQAGEAIFFIHPQHSWVRGSIVSMEKDTATCKVDDKERKDVKIGEQIVGVKSHAIEPFHNECLDDANKDDLLQLSALSEATLLRCLYLRYMSDVIYTNIGAIVVALNPFNFEIPRYKDDKMPKFLGLGKHFDKVPNHGLYPHSWATAHNTYYELIDNKENQCVLISGESGAGKTEATKIVMKYLAAVSCLDGSVEEKKLSESVGKQLEACSPILECFGNAKTSRNDNSSRFGKFMEVKFNASGKLIGAFTTKYLLEKSRIISASPGERIYHSFYVALRGKYKGHLQFESEATYVSVNSGKCLNNKEYDTAEDFEEVCEAMKKIKMSDDDVKSVWHIPAAILNLINIQFDADKVDPDKSTMPESSQKFLMQAAKLLYINDQELLKEFLSFVRTTPDGDITSRTSVDGAKDARNALCKHMYDGVFAWLVERCNETCDAKSASGNWVGLLDIFGFEDFQLNSFEQLCINLTNETLQNHYNSFIFTKDMAECRAEGINVEDIVCPDNSKCLHMLTGQGGIIPLLDECCAIEKSTDFSFAEKVDNGHSKNPFYGKNKVSRDTFVIHHYAGDVTYTVTGWIDKNRDTLRDQMKLLVRKSTDKIIGQCLPMPIPKDKQKGGRAPTVGGFFAMQVKSLMEKISSTNPHWIRCVKPHPAKQPLQFDGVQTMKQLESSGVMGTVKIRKAGYPVRIQNERFLQKYLVCVTVQGDSQAKIQNILANAGLTGKENSQCGLTKVFLKTHALTKLERFRDECLRDIIALLQRIGYGFLGRKSCFLTFVEKHRAELLRQKREREERERAEREAEERARREAEEKARLIREAEERRRKREEQKLQEKRNKAAICIQRYVTGSLCRIRVFRQVLEESRAKFEHEREMALIEERRAARGIDLKRKAAEKLWISWLNNADHLRNKSSVDKQRKISHLEQTMRIALRELARREEECRSAIEAEKIHDQQVHEVRSKLMEQHRGQLREHENKAKKLFEQQTASTPKFNPPPPPTSMHRSARSDARTRDLLGDYATQRARAFEEYFPPPPPKQTFASLTSETHQRSTKGLPTPQTQRDRFDIAKNRWVEQDEWVDTRVGFAAPVSFGNGTDRREHSSVDDAYSGPHRTVDSILSSSHPPQQLLSQSSPARRSEEPPWMRQSAVDHTSMTMSGSQKVRPNELRSAVDWDAVFNS